MARAFSQIVAGLPGAEGPVCDRRGQLYMVVPDEGRVVAIDEGGRVREIARTGGIPAGLQVDRAGELWCADMRRGILRISPNGAVTPVVERFQGAPIRGCNDCVFDRFGNLYFTAPAGSAADRPVGELFCLTAAGTLHRLDGGYRFCNGIAVSADGRQLFVAETYTKTVWRFEIGGEGTVGQKTAWARLPGEHYGGPDGMDFDAAGLLLVTNWGGASIDVFSPDGSLVERIETPFSRPSNLHFGGEDRMWVFVTEHDTHGLWKFRWERPGQPHYVDGPAAG